MSTKGETIFGEWLDMLLEVTQKNYRSDLEPFNVYKERMKAQGIKAFKDYIKSLEHGYNVILEQIKSEEQGKK